LDQSWPRLEAIDAERPRSLKTLWPTSLKILDDIFYVFTLKGAGFLKLFLK
jgi:hypothetical protein